MSAHDRPRRPWTPADDAILRDMTASGSTARQVGIRLDRTYAAIHRRLKRLRSLDAGLAPPAAPVSSVEWTPAEIGRLREIIHGGGTARAASEALRRSLPAVHRMMHTQRLRTLATRIDQNVADAILYRARQQWRPSRIARQVGLGLHLLEAVLRQRYPNTSDGEHA